MSATALREQLDRLGHRAIIELEDDGNYHVDLGTLLGRLIPPAAMDAIAERLAKLDPGCRSDMIYDAFDAVLLPLTGLHRGLRDDGQVHQIDVEIFRTRRALQRHAKILEEMRETAQPPAHCCPSCFYGREYSELCDKHSRVVAWLVRLLFKRGWQRDYLEARTLLDFKEPDADIVDPWLRNLLRITA